MRALAALFAVAALALVPAASAGSAPAPDDRAAAAAAKKRCAKGSAGTRCRRRALCTRRHLKRVGELPAAKRRQARRRWRSCLAKARRHQGSGQDDPGSGDPGSGDPGSGDPSDPGSGDPGSGNPPPGRSMSVTAREWSLSPSRAVLAAGTQTVELRNWGEDPHNLVISPDDGSHAPLYTWPETASLDLYTMGTALGPGRYLLWCSLEGHEIAGMRSTVRVE